jgi:hypothetical protein
MFELLRIVNLIICTMIPMKYSGSRAMLLDLSFVLNGGDLDVYHTLQQRQGGMAIMVWGLSQPHVNAYNLPKAYTLSHTLLQFLQDTNIVQHVANSLARAANEGSLSRHATSKASTHVMPQAKHPFSACYEQ